MVVKMKARKIIAKNIMEYIVEKDYSVSRAALEFGIAQSHMRAILKGDVAVQVDTLEKIAEIIGCEAWELLKLN